MKISEEYGNNFLDFSRTTAEHSGKYTCIARNHTGTISSDFELKVSGKYYTPYIKHIL